MSSAPRAPSWTAICETGNNPPADHIPGTLESGNRGKGRESFRRAIDVVLHYARRDDRREPQGPGIDPQGPLDDESWPDARGIRSEERRVGKECRSRLWRYR